jgi:hypothetical protein
MYITLVTIDFVEHSGGHNASLLSTFFCGTYIRQGARC